MSNDNIQGFPSNKKMKVLESEGADKKFNTSNKSERAF